MTRTKREAGGTAWVSGGGPAGKDVGSPMGARIGRRAPAGRGAVAGQARGLVQAVGDRYTRPHVEKGIDGAQVGAQRVAADVAGVDRLRTELSLEGEKRRAVPTAGAQPRRARGQGKAGDVALEDRVRWR